MGGRINGQFPVEIANQIWSLRRQDQLARLHLMLDCDWISTSESWMDLTNPGGLMAEGGEGKFPNRPQFIM